MSSSHEKIYGVKNPKKRTIYDAIDKYMVSKYAIRFDELGHEFQISFKDQNTWEVLETNSFLIELAQAGITINPAKLEIYLKSYFIPRFNPIAEYFKKLPQWCGEDHIQALVSYLPLKEPELFLYHFKKWLVRAVKCALEQEYFNKQCLVLVHPQQNSGKSTWCRFLCPPVLSKYLAEDMATDKDARIQLTRNFLINLDELSVLAKKEINALKAYFSKTMINERLPYDKKNTTLCRTCSFVGSTNRATFLNDETGSVRWLCFELDGSIDFGYSSAVDINKVWSQAYHLAYGAPSFHAELTLKDIAQNEQRNKTYRETSMEEELLCKYYTKSDNLKDFRTASDVVIQLACINPRLNMYSMGRAVKSVGYERVKPAKERVYGYLIKPLFRSSPLELLQY